MSLQVWLGLLALESSRKLIRTAHTWFHLTGPRTINPEKGPGVYNFSKQYTYSLQSFRTPHCSATFTGPNLSLCGEMEPWSGLPFSWTYHRVAKSQTWLSDWTTATLMKETEFPSENHLGPWNQSQGFEKRNLKCLSRSYIAWDSPTITAHSLAQIKEDTFFPRPHWKQIASILLLHHSL